MYIFVIKSSPHKYSSSGLLADEFIKGAKDAGQEITVFDAGHKKIEPCSACDYCLESGECFKKDDMHEVEKGICKRYSLKNLHNEMDNDPFLKY